MVWIDSDFPILLGQELFRPDAKYITKYVTRPRVIHDFTKGPGDTVQLDRYKFWAGENGLTKESRERSDTQTLGIASSRKIEKDKVILSLKEYTGPCDQTDPNAPSTFQIPLRNIMTAQRQLWQYGQRAFHDSIGSSNLLQDFRRWEDRLYINELLKTTNVYNPRGLSFASGSTIDLSKNDFAGKPPKFNVIDDLEQVVADLTARNAPTFEDGTYACLCSPYFLKDLRSDPKFMEISRYPGQIGSADMLAPAGAMQPPQIPFCNAVWQNGLMAGQARSVGMQDMMPTGFVFDGVRFFVSNNLPKAQAPAVTYQNANNSNLNASATRTAEIAIFFGPEAIGLGVGGAGPEILLNNNDDFQRFVIAIWRMYGAWELLDERFITVARSFSN
jgi:hypothetical protein